MDFRPASSPAGDGCLCATFAHFPRRVAGLLSEPFDPSTASGDQAEAPFDDGHLRVPHVLSLDLLGSGDKAPGVAVAAAAHEGDCFASGFMGNRSWAPLAGLRIAAGTFTPVCAFPVRHKLLRICPIRAELHQQESDKGRRTCRSQKDSASRQSQPFQEAGCWKSAGWLSR